MATIDIIPDIHGRADKLRAALDGLGWRRTPAGWNNPEPDRRIVFLGDYIDRGRENGAVISLVRALVDAGKAQAIMGNHEFNALQFHTPHPETGAPLRPHTAKNIDQHRSFLEEFAPGAPETRSVIEWMRSLPLFVEEDSFRAVHACWVDASIEALRGTIGGAVLGEDHVTRSAHRDDPLFDLVEEITKGPEQPLPEGYAVRDKEGHEHHAMRVKWWYAAAVTWRDAAMSVSNLDCLPDGPLPQALRDRTYPTDAKPVFFGHYWMSGDPVLQAPNVLCLDYSAGKTGPLVTYTLTVGDQPLRVCNIKCHSPRENATPINQ